MGASPAVPKTSSKGKFQQAVGGRAFRGYAIAPVLCSIPRWNTVRSSRCSPLHYTNHQAPPIPCAFPAVKPQQIGKSLLRSKTLTLAFTVGKHLLASPSHPRQGVPTPAKRLSCGRQCYGLPFRYGHGSYLSVACAPLTPLRAAVPFACSHRFGGSTSCLSRQPHKACCCHSPLRSPSPLKGGARRAGD